MLLVGALITTLCNVKLGDIAGTSVFKSGMVACICVLGVAWLGDTFVAGHTKEIKEFASHNQPISSTSCRCILLSRYAPVLSGRYC